MDAISSALSGMTSATQKLDSAAAMVAKSGPDPQAAVDAASAVTAFKANAVVARIADQMTGALLNIMA